MKVPDTVVRRQPASLGRASGRANAVGEASIRKRRETAESKAGESELGNGPAELKSFLSFTV